MNLALSAGHREYVATQLLTGQATCPGSYLLLCALSREGRKTDPVAGAEEEKSIFFVYTSVPFKYVW